MVQTKKGSDAVMHGNNPNVFSASNKQSYATSKKFTSDNPFDMKKLMQDFEYDSDD